MICDLKMVNIGAFTCIVKNNTFAYQERVVPIKSCELINAAECIYKIAVTVKSIKGTQTFLIIQCDGKETIIPVPQPKTINVKNTTIRVTL